MKTISYSKDQLKSSFGLHDKLESVFRKIEADLMQTGEVVCRFKVNGLDLSEADEKRFETYQLTEVELIEVESESKDLLLTEVIKSWISSLPQLISQTDQLALQFKEQKNDGLFKQFVDLVDSCQFLIDSLISLRTIVNNYPPELHKQWQESQKLTVHAISEALEAFEKKDFIILSDILEYDLGNCLQNWLETLKTLKGYVEKKASDSLDR